MMDEITTLDGLLNRRVQLEQPKIGYRVAVDTVLLAAAVPKDAGNYVLELGCGVGGALLCLACRLEGTSGMGIDIQPDLIELFRRNIARNSFASGLKAQVQDVKEFTQSGFDQVIMNPPYHDEMRHDASAHAGKRLANSEKEGDLAIWIAVAYKALKQDGVLTLIHKADRQEEILQSLNGFGGIEILQLLPKKGELAKRIIVRARKGAVEGVQICMPLVLHKSEGGYTEDADLILRGAQALIFQSP